MGIKADIRRQVVHQAQASRDCIPTLVESGLRRMIDHLEIDMVITQRSDQRQLLGQARAVLDERRRGIGPRAATFSARCIHPRNVQEVARLEAIWIDGVEGAFGQRVIGLLVGVVIHAQRPIAGQAEQLSLVSQLDSVTVDLLVVPLAVTAGAGDGAVVAVVAVDLKVAVIALAIVVVEGIAQLGIVVQLVVRDRAYPAGALLVATVLNVVVVEAVVLVDLQLAGQRLQYRRAPVRTVFLLFQVFDRQRMGESVVDVAEQREGQVARTVLLAIYVAVAAGAAVVEARIVARAIAAVERFIEADRGFPGVVATVAHSALEGIFLTVGKLGDHVQAAPHGTAAVEERGRAAEQLHPVINPGADRTGRATVLQIDAVEQLADLGTVEATVRHIAAPAGWRRSVNPRQSVRRVLKVACADTFHRLAIGRAYRGGIFPGTEIQARAAFDGSIQVQAGGRFRLVGRGVDVAGG